MELSDPLRLSRMRTFGLIALFTLVLAGCSGPTQLSPVPPHYAAPTSLPVPAATQTPIYVVLEPTERSSIGAAVPETDDLTAVVDDTVASPVAGSEADCQYRMDLVSDVTIPDGTLVEPGARFTKTWRLRNAGTCPWSKAFTLRWAEGSRLGGPEALGVPETALGKEIDVSVSMIAPAEPGEYTSIWRLHTAEGQPFGVPPYVNIRVPASASSPATEAAPLPVPTATATPTADPIPGNIASYVMNITPTARQIYLDGLELGNRANVFSMIGDSITHSWYFMKPVGEGLTQLHDYDYLWPVIDYYSTANARIDTSFSNPSLAVHFGWTSFDVLNPDNGEPGCDGRSPLVCELEVVRPAVAIILIGSNDSTAPTVVADYQRNLDQIVQTTVDYGVIPVLSTIPFNTYANTGPFNQVMLDVAVAHDVPWVDFRTLMDSVPNRGLGPDGMHPSVPPDNNPANFSADNLQFGYTLRNLLTVQALYAVWTGAMY